MSCRACRGPQLCPTCQALLDRAAGATQRPAQADLREAALRRRLLDVSQPTGWLHYHTHDSRGSEKGWPDDAWIRPYDALILAELKTATGKLSQEQATWLSVLQTVTRVETYLWRPGDYEAIVARLTRPRGGGVD